MTDPITDPCSCSQAGATHQRGDQDFCRDGAVLREFRFASENQEPLSADLTLTPAARPTAGDPSGALQTIGGSPGGRSSPENAAVASNRGRNEATRASAWLQFTRILDRFRWRHR